MKKKAGCFSLRDGLDGRCHYPGRLPGVDSAMLPLGRPEGLPGRQQAGLIQQALDDASSVVARAAERCTVAPPWLKMRKYGMSRRDDEGMDD
jgi:sigma-54 specific flagellar transcriptional regulator A